MPRPQFTLRALLVLLRAVPRGLLTFYRDAARFRQSMQGLVRHLKDQENR